MTKDQINYNHFESIDIRAGTIIVAEEFPQARKPAYKLTIDLGPEIGIKHSSAQITEMYQPDQLIGRQVICVCNFPAKQIGPFVSEVLTTGFANNQGKIILAQPDSQVPNGSQLF